MASAPALEPRVSYAEYLERVTLVSVGCTLAVDEVYADPLGA
jgi:hypothetical protein